ncbi:transient receptor potential cation channel subfamily A member 1 homolog [Mercenaria mercenaria]|uniref:transient receptor potential cation channel subfamily A member 1 homolog n=1 Tax=Mercenaria mercenaria TaxID=6596 RepID=UPI00234F9BE3|nr:transient receptor potential cation channel subfamily A member 1 homolog [Mercenaria mercenaria]
MGALLIRHIVPADVRELFLTDAENTAFKECKQGRKSNTLPDETVDVLSLNYLISSDATFVKTIQAVFDSLKDVDDSGLATVYIKLLEEDDKGLEPPDEGFNDHFHTVFHNLINAQKEVTNHPVIGMLIDHKWNTWGRRRFALNFLLYLLSLFSLTFSVVTAVMADNVRRYDTSLQRARAFFEITLCILSFYRLVTEIWQIKRHMLDYWKQFNNWIELLSSSIIFLVLILRFTTENAHWFVLAVTYVLWVLRIFKYAAVSTQTGAYAESLRQILIRNFVPFSLLFIVVNVAFSGVFLLVLKGEGSLNTHEETSTIFGILFVGLRTMIEAQPIVEYTGSDGYGTAGIIVMLVFLSMTIVVLLNILIAQLSDTYSEIQGDAVKSVRANRVAILTRLERNEWQMLSYIIDTLSQCRCTVWLLSLCGCIKCDPVNWRPISVGNRKKYYKSVFENIDLKHQHQSYTTLLEDMDERIHELRRLQIKTDLKAQTLKSRLRQLDKKN